MTTKVFVLICLILGYSALASDIQTKPSQNLLRTVVLPDSIKHQLGIFLQRKEKLTSPASAILVYNYPNPEDIRFKDGLYTFSLLGPHFQPRIFIFENGRLQIFERIDINGLLGEYLAYIKRPGIAERNKIKYLHLIWRFLDEGFKREG
jgi:hypothetical protein